MITNLGDFATGQTVYVPFHTFDSNDPSASVTITGLAVTDIEIYKNGSVTQRASDNGYTLLDTDGIDFDTITGLHGISIDLSDNSDAGFYAAGATYWVAISSITVDAATINFWAAIFTIAKTGGVADILSDTEAVLTDSEAILTDSEAILADTEAAVPVLTDTEAVLADTEAAITERSTLLTDTEAILVDSEAIIVDSEAIIADTETISTALPTNFVDMDIEAGSGAVLLRKPDSIVARSGTAQAGGANTVTLDASASSTNDHYKDMVCWIYAGAGADQAIPILSYNGTTKVATVAENWTTQPDVTSSFALIAIHVHPVSDIQSGLATLTDSEAILADTNELQTDWADAGRLDAILDAVLVDTEAVIVDTEAVIVDTEAVLVDTEAATGVLTDTEAILADTNELQTDWTDAGRLDAILDAVLVDTEAAVVDTEAILVDSEAIIVDSEAVLVDTEAIAADMPQRITKNTALAGFEFLMVDSTDDVTGKTGLTVTATRSIDGAAFGACANAVAEVSNGIYKIDLAASDLNGDTITLRFAATGANDTFVSLVTQPT